MKNVFEKISSVILTLAAAAIAVAFVHREFAVRASALAEAPTFTTVKNWPMLLRDGRLIGDSAAAVKILEFSDFECPFCRRSDSAFHAIAAVHPSDVALIHVHFPLSMHRFAMPAARAAECAANQGRFAQMHDLLFEKQDSLGLMSWVDFAHEAGVQDTATFLACNSARGVPERVAKGLTDGEALGLHETPVVIINGTRVYPPPSAPQLEQIVDSLLRLRTRG